ncbi:MAG TPA: GTP 3',8-cyclase MoaA [Herbaspirillum sp.]|jgi:cyclic pyranopterin phosphate synthase
MTVIPIHDLRQKSPAAASLPAFAMDHYPTDGHLLDQMGRPLRDLRISVTDRCNFRCVYCMPKEIFDKDYRFLPHSALLSFEEIERVAKVFVAHGVQKIRLTGGEPLLRKNLERLVAMLRQLPTPDGKPLDLTLTTNGALLAKKAQALKDAGLDRVTVSLDSLDDANFKRMNDADFPVSQVLEGIDAAHRAGLGPIKINMVVKKGVNDHEIPAMARHFRNTPYILRFIEYMDVGSSNGWRMDEVLPSDQVVARIAGQFPLSPAGANYPGETARRWRYDDGAGEIGVISSVTHAFCGDCNRARLSTEGKLYTCLFGTAGHDLRALLRGDNSQDSDIANAIGHIWHQRSDRYSESRAAHTGEPVERIARKVEMSYIGG